MEYLYGFKTGGSQKLVATFNSEGTGNGGTGNEESCIRQAESAWDPARLCPGLPDTTFFIL